MRDAGTALVVGASGGLGQAIAERLAQDREAVCLTYHSNAQRAATLRERLSPLCAVESVRMDIRRDDDVAAACARAEEMPGGLRAIVFASGANILQPYISEIPQQQWDAVIDTELLGFIRLVRNSLPYLRKSRGVLVSVVSFANRHYPPGDALSAVPKAGIEMLTRALAREEGRHGIRANSVAPGIISAGLGSALQEKVFTPEIWEQQRKRVPLRRFGEAHEVADAVAYLASARSSYVTGQTIVVDGGLEI